jgi:hypothetical protein
MEAVGMLGHEKECVNLLCLLLMIHVLSAVADSIIHASDS